MTLRILAVAFVLFIVSCTPEEEEKVTYTDDIASIMTNNCVTCHSGAAPAAGLELINYDNVRASAKDGNLLARIEDSANPMPPSGLMADSNIDKLKQWAEDGFPEN